MARFLATQKWNEMVVELYNKTPRVAGGSRHPDAFTGRDATDTVFRAARRLFPDRTVKRVNGIRVLQQMLKQMIIENERGVKDDLFIDHSSVYYKFTAYGVDKYIPDCSEEFRAREAEAVEFKEKSRRSGSLVANIRNRCRRFLSTERQATLDKENVETPPVRLLSSRCMSPQIQRFRPYVNVKDDHNRSVAAAFGSLSCVPRSRRQVHAEQRMSANLTALSLNDGPNRAVTDAPLPRRFGGAKRKLRSVSTSSTDRFFTKIKQRVLNKD
ncbi:unnamed protein product [Bursaphelenchus okinawaensis]|uniref:DEP domain-containing protein n=1 Tax=Bursaphelenchus okinawaensis TaxID=465554 RepID=A0A811K3B8_9BILA|nr:unnamed protein product [Bursaphelenchus okinawaensis]CAG9089720.1 unnamed protein product [Bursaphelenchus okinawaensis]